MQKACVSCTNYLSSYNGHKVVGFEDVDCLFVARDKDHWRVILNTVMNLRIP